MSDDQTIDEGPKGFLGIFGSDAATPDVDTPDTDSPDTTDEPLAADATTPEEDASDGTDLSAEERVAANLAASLEDDGVDPEPEPVTAEATADTDDTPFDFAALSPEEQQAFIDEAIALKGQLANADEEKVVAEIGRAEQAAGALWNQREQTADVHYANELTKRLDRAWDQSQDQDNPKQWFNAVRQREEATVAAAKTQWLQEQANTLDAELQRFRQEQLRPWYAKQLVKEAGLPASAAKELLEDPDWQRYPKEVQRLIAIRDLLATQQNDKTQAVRAEGRKRLIETASVTVPSSGRARSQKRVAYEGDFAEGLSIMKTMSKMR